MAVCRLANPVTLGDDHGGLFVATGGQIRIQDGGQQPGLAEVVNRLLEDPKCKARYTPALLCGVPLWFLLVDAAGRCFPSVPSRPGLGDFPALRLFDAVAGAAARSGVARTRFPALVVGDRGRVARGDFTPGLPQIPA